MNNIPREFSALLKAEEFIPMFAKKFIWAPALSRKGSLEKGSWARIMSKDTKLKDSLLLQPKHSQDLVQDKMVIQQLDQNHDAAMAILPWPLYVKQGYFTSSKKNVSTPVPCLGSFLMFSSTCTCAQVSRSNLENTGTGQEQFKPANKFNEMQTFICWGMDCAKRIELIPLPSCKERIKKAYCKPHH